jgi:hypothetical protein
LRPSSRNREADFKRQVIPTEKESSGKLCDVEVTRWYANFTTVFGESFYLKQYRTISLESTPGLLLDECLGESLIYPLRASLCGVGVFTYIFKLFYSKPGMYGMYGTCK